MSVVIILQLRIIQPLPHPTKLILISIPIHLLLILLEVVTHVTHTYQTKEQHHCEIRIQLTLMDTPIKVIRLSLNETMTVRIHLIQKTLMVLILTLLHYIPIHIITEK